MTINLRNTYRFTTVDSSVPAVICLRGDGAPKMTGPSAGWEIVPRPRRVAFTQWIGRDPYTMDVPIMLDGYRRSDSIEEEVARLNQMKMGENLKPPPKVQLEGAVPVKGATWVIADITWGDNVVWRVQNNQRMFRIRQDAIVHLLQYVREDRLNIKKSKRARRHTVKKGETLKSIAAKYDTTVSALKKANGIRDPKSVKPGRVIKVP